MKQSKEICNQKCRSRQNPKRKIVKLKKYYSAADIFELFAEEKDIVFLDSSMENDLGQYSIIGMAPYLKLVKEGEKFTENGALHEESFEDYLKKYLTEHFDENETELPIVSGAIGYFSYDYGRKRMGISSVHSDHMKIPDAVMIFYDIFVIEDRRKRCIWLIANGETGAAESVLGEIQKKLERLNTKQYTNVMEDRSRQKEKSQGENEESFKGQDNVGEAVSFNFERLEYMNTVERMIRYIIDGDIYVANMTQQLKIASRKKPYQVFQLLREENPSPFGGYLNYGDFQIVCASPERFLRMKNGRVETRPIKGTRKRGVTPEEDEKLRKELEMSEKDKSELLMIVDLERNDLNRVCIPGSVKVTELFSVETYATVFHLVANVEGKLRQGLTVMDLLEAAFPGGSITGAPKYRAMEIIDELEHGQRNLYTGSIGYLTLDNSCDFNIVIRTALYKDGCYYLGAGGGITAESETAFEYEETLQKAKALVNTIMGVAENADYIG